MIKVVVDGVEVFVERGSTVLQACEKVGLEIPRFCYHERLSIAGNCRMCLVEIFKTPKPVASCAMPTMADMQIFTNTPLVKKAREAVLEFMLLNHPLDCPICDQGGECDLQDQAMAFGSDRSRYYETKRGVENKNCGPLIKTIMTRCIHCTRCVRFATEIAGVEDLGTTGRGRETEIGTYIEKTFKSELSGNVIDLCPVGALTSKPYAFLSRPWELRSTESIDISDALGSNIRIDSRGTEILRILPRFNEEINEEWISDKARFSYDGLKVKRLTNIQSYGGWDKINLESKPISFTNVCTGFIGESVDSYATLQLQSLFKNTFNSKLLFRVPGFLDGVDADFRSNYSLSTPIANLEKADVCLLVGANTRYEASMLNVSLRKRFLEGGLTVATVGPACDLTFQTEHLGITLETLARIAEGKHPFSKKLAQAKYPVILLGGTALKGVFDTKVALNLVDSIASRLPKINGSSWENNHWQGLNFLPSGANQVGQMDLGIIASPWTEQYITNHTSGRHINFYVGTDIPEFDQDKSVFDYVNLARWSHIPSRGIAMCKNYFIDSHMNGNYENTYEKDKVTYYKYLPGAAFTEKTAPYVNAEGRLQRTRRVFKAPADAREDWKIVTAIRFSQYNRSNLMYTVGEMDSRLIEISPTLSSGDDTISPSKLIAFGRKYTDFKTKVSKYNTRMTRKVPDFYTSGSDPISRYSRVMAKCSSVYYKISSYQK